MIVCVADQPIWVARVSAYTSTMRPLVTVTAPATSKLRRASAPAGSRESRNGVRPIRTAPIGTLTKKIHSQPNALVRTPPSSAPAAAPLPAIPPQMPRARLRSRPSVKVVARMDSAAGESKAPPKPWTARNAISDPSDQARPHMSEAPVKTASPVMKIRRRPNRSARRPPSSRKPPNRIA